MRHALLPVMLLLVACGEDAPTDTPIPPGCGDGIHEPAFEACDDGAANAFEPDACRPTCDRPACGDGIVDSGEACDDGNAVGGDGCTPACRAEEGVLEQEPNDTPDAATGLGDDERGHGSLGEGDVDCFAVSVPQDGYIAADVFDGEACPDEDVLLRLVAPDGSSVATSSPGGADGCSPLDPIRQPGARFLVAGDWSVCAEGFLGREVSAYTLTVEVGETCDLEGVPVRDNEDGDGDGLIDACDDDDDGDGILDVDDNCPRTPNSGEVVDLRPRGAGWITDWLVLGPLEDLSSPDGCLPGTGRLASEDGAVVPALSGIDAGLAWRVLRTPDERVDLRGPLGGATGREAFMAVWVQGGDAAREVTLSLGPDDGARAWWNGTQVLEDRRCQGTSRDANEVPVTLEPGWNRLVVQVYDQGGGWGLFARLKDSDGGLEDVPLSVQSGGPWRPDQTDTDGDGRGDACDDTPAG